MSGTEIVESGKAAGTPETFKFMFCHGQIGKERRLPDFEKKALGRDAIPSE